MVRNESIMDLEILLTFACWKKKSFNVFCSKVPNKLGYY